MSARTRPPWVRIPEATRVGMAQGQCRGCLGCVRGPRAVPVPAGCTLGGQEVKLCIHYEGGFTVCREEGGGSVLFRYPYEKLKMSADDGIRTLYLDFGGPEGELVRTGPPRAPTPGSWCQGCPRALTPLSPSLRRRWTCTPAPSPSSSSCTPSSRPKSPAWGCWCRRRPRSPRPQPRSTKQPEEAQSPPRPPPAAPVPWGRVCPCRGTGGAPVAPPGPEAISHLTACALERGRCPPRPTGWGWALRATAHPPPPKGSCLNNLGTQGNAGTRSHGAAAGGGLGPPPCCSQTLRARKQTPPSPSWGRGRPGLGAAGPLGRGGGGSTPQLWGGRRRFMHFRFLYFTSDPRVGTGAGGCPRRAPGQTPPQTFLLPAGLRGPWGAPSPRPRAAQPLLFLYSL